MFWGKIVAIKTELFVSAFRMVEVDGRTNIPSIVHFSAADAAIGYQAIERAEDVASLNENFKLNLGEIPKGQTYPPQFETGDGKLRSAHAITRTYIERLMKHAAAWVEGRGQKHAHRVLVAEPLALDRSEISSADWLTNYRYQLRAILGSLFNEVDFLPEPFAVFQYYRYGVRHPLVSERRRHAALVVDFGGGTFDVSVVDTTGTGDVREGGRNSRPLAAASLPVGGSMINLQVAKELVSANLEKGVDRSKLDRAWVTFRSGADAAGGMSALSVDLQNFVRNVRRMISQIERAKIHICETIADWSADATYDPVPAALVGVPKNPFAQLPTILEVRFDAYQLRKLFIGRVWQPQLRGAIANAISRSVEELDGRPINLVLLSGGSANLKWLADLIRGDLGHLLLEAEIIELQGKFHEIVAQGLAIECARRTYNEGVGDFKAVTYNRLCLVLGTDEQSPGAYRFRPQNVEGQPDEPSDGTLLHSAQALQGCVDKPLRWKVRLPSPPKHHLDYYFLKSSLDFNDLPSLHNVDHRAFTPPKTRFDAQVTVELTVDEKGSAHPRFIYRHGHGQAEEVSVKGKPFYMDMTTLGATSVGEAYLGLDFGTSNSSVAYVEREAVRVFTQRAGEEGWRELNELCNTLPYPVAHPLAKFVAGADERMLREAFPEAFESTLHMLMVLAYIDYCANKGTKASSIFKTFTKASAGPSWGIIRTLVEMKVKGGDFMPSMVRLLPDVARKQIDAAIDAINDVKHHRIPKQFDYHRVLGLVGNMLGRALTGWSFGSFEAVSKLGFGTRHKGLFRVAAGSHAPFIHVLAYDGPQAFSEQEALLLNQEKSVAIRLSPFYFWTIRDEHQDRTVAILDSTDKLKSTYRTVESGVTYEIASGHDLVDLHDMCRAVAEQDQELAGQRCDKITVILRE